MFSAPVLLLQTFAVVLISNKANVGAATKCEPMKVTRCKKMPWTLTHMPNLVHHSSQKNADLVLSQFEPLLKQPCSQYLEFFLCSMFTPMCFQLGGDFPKVVPPCRKICQHARDGCEPLLLKHNVTWPEQLACDNLPEYHRGMCIEPTAFIKRPEVTPSCSVTSPVQCKKCRRFKVKDRTFMEQDYDFLVRATVDKVTQNACDAEVRVNVSEIFRMKTVVISPGIRTMVFNNSCACPKVKRKREYLLGGHEDSQTGKLLLHPQSLAEKWGRKWQKKILKWVKKKNRTPPLNRRRRTNNSASPPKSRRSKKAKRGRRAPESE